MKKILSAQTSFSNDETTDLLPEVLHNVYVEINGLPFTLQLMAECPMDAIHRVRQMDERECLNIRKII